MTNLADATETIGIISLLLSIGCLVFILASLLMGAIDIIFMGNVEAIPFYRNFIITLVVATFLFFIGGIVLLWLSDWMWNRAVKRAKDIRELQQQEYKEEN